MNSLRKLHLDLPQNRLDYEKIVVISWITGLGFTTLRYYRGYGEPAGGEDKRAFTL